MMLSTGITPRPGQILYKLGAPHDVIFRVGPLTVVVSHDIHKFGQYRAGKNIGALLSDTLLRCERQT